MNFITFMDCQRVLLWSNGHFRPKSVINFSLVIVASVMFAIATVDITFGIKNAMSTFAFYQGSGGPEDYLAIFANWKTLKTALFFVQTVIGDGVW